MKAKQTSAPACKETDVLKRGIKEVENWRRRERDAGSQVKELSGSAGSRLPSQDKGIPPGLVLGTSPQVISISGSTSGHVTN